MNDKQQFEFLDVLTILSFALQVENQGKVIGLTDVQNEVNRAIGEIHTHLEEQDRMIRLLLERMGENDIHSIPVGPDRSGDS